MGDDEKIEARARSLLESDVEHILEYHDGPIVGQAGRDLAKRIVAALSPSPLPGRDEVLASALALLDAMLCHYGQHSGIPSAYAKEVGELHGAVSRALKKC